MTRRELLKLLSAVPILLLAPPLQSQPRADSTTQATQTIGNWNRVAVLVELHGGNDGLNTVIPYSHSTYYALRPHLAIPRDQVRQLSPTFGVHPALEPLMPLWEANELAIVNGVGYANPNRSHFRSIEIWETGSNSQEFLDGGWLSRVFQQYPPPSSFTADAVVLGHGNAGPVGGGKTRAIALHNPQQFLKRSQSVPNLTTRTTNRSLAHVLEVQHEILRAARSLATRLQRMPAWPNDFPNTKISKQLQTAAQLITAGIPVPVIKVTHGSFDTHAGQPHQHRRLLQELADGLSAFRDSLLQQGLWNQVVVMTYSEFGRRVAENGSVGTDHGAAAPHFFLGGRVKGGLYGTPSSLTDLKNGDVRFTVDYRRLYATLLQNWWGLPANVLDSQIHPAIDCLA